MSIENKNNQYFALFLMLLIIFLPFITSNIYYIDDIGRSSEGYTRWGIDGRPFADAVMIALNFGKHISDMHPLPHILALGFVLFTFYNFRNEYVGKDIYASLVMVSFFSSPFIFEVLTYRFDVLTIMIGISLCFYAFYVRCKSHLLSYVTQTLILVAALSSYQIVINVFLILVVMEFASSVAKNINNKDIIIKGVTRLSQASLSLLVYMKIVLPASFDGEHGDNHPSISSNLFNSLVENSGSYYKYFCESLFGGATTYILAIVVAIGFVSSLIISSAYYKQNGSSGLICSLLLVITPFLAFPLTMVSLLALNSSISHFPRVYIGISAYIMYICFLFYKACSVSKLETLKAMILIPIIYGAGYGYSYVNALSDQDKLNRQTIYSIKENTKDIDYDTVYPIFVGNAPESPVLSNAKRNYPLISSMVVNYFSTWYWPHRYWSFNGYHQLYLRKKTGLIDYNKKIMCSFEVYKKTQDFTIRKNGDIIIIDFNRSKC
ncbi:TPA: glucosyltransferase domain-containing protein [Escherichia coli]|nr:glucosyltransferase domain-containing protein [Escherichia coli]HBL0189382.1 glucosyltransferase domain-containing protein [Escherichia coli]